LARSLWSSAAALAAALLLSASPFARPVRPASLSGIRPSEVSHSAGDDATLRRLNGAIGTRLHVLQAVSRDLDRDGDLDIVASTSEELLVVWINDGSGHFTRVRLRSVPAGVSEGTQTYSSREQAPPSAVPSPRSTHAIAAPALPGLDGRAPPHDRAADSPAISLLAHATRFVRGPPARSSQV